MLNTLKYRCVSMDDAGQKSIDFIRKIKLALRFAPDWAVQARGRHSSRARELESRIPDPISMVESKEGSWHFAIVE